MPATHKDLCKKAVNILAARIELYPISLGEIAHEDAGTIAKLVELFGSEQREADANEPLTLAEFQTLTNRTLPMDGVQHFFQDRGAVSGMTSADFVESRQRFEAHIDLIHALFGLSGEVGELVDPVKKSMFYGKPLDVENIKEEAGDLLWYIAGPLCRALGCTLEDLARQNVAKLQKRYPEKYTDQAAIDRADKSEIQD